MLNLDRFLMGKSRGVAGEQVFKAENSALMDGPRKVLELAGITVNFVGLLMAVFGIGGFMFFLVVPVANPYIGLLAFVGMPAVFVIGVIMYTVGGVMESIARKKRLAQV